MLSIILENRRILGLQYESCGSNDDGCRLLEQSRGRSKWDEGEICELPSYVAGIFEAVIFADITKILLFYYRPQIVRPSSLGVWTRNQELPIAHREHIQPLVMSQELWQYCVVIVRHVDV